MSSNIDKIIFTEAEYFYKSEHAIVDYSQMQSFSLIKSCIEIFAYYGIGDFVPSDVKEFFEKIQLIQKKNGKVFIPSAKKVDGVMECCLHPSDCHLSHNGNSYHIEKWNSDGYKYEIASAYSKGYIKK